MANMKVVYTPMTREQAHEKVRNYTDHELAVVGEFMTSFRNHVRGEDVRDEYDYWIGQLLTETRRRAGL